MWTDCIEHIFNAGFDGWVGNFSIGAHTGIDVAVFDPSKANIIEAKIKLDDKWTGYMPINEVYEFLEEYFA